MKRKRSSIVLLALIFSGVVVFLIVTAFILPGNKIGKYDEAYQSLEKGARTEEVVSLMGPPSATNSLATEFWDGSRLSDRERAEISRTFDYRVGTFFLPVTFRFSFDTNGRLVGKHRYD